MWKVTWSGIRARKFRFVSTAIAIVLGVGFMSGTYVFTDTLTKTFDDLFASVYSGTDAVVRSTVKLDTGGGGLGDRRQRIGGEVIAEVRSVPGVERAEPMIRGYAQLVKRSNQPLGGRNAPTFGMNWVDDTRLNPYRLAEGRAPAAADEIVIDRASSRLGKFALGDSVKVLSQSPTATYTVVGIATFGSADSAAGAGTVFFTADQAAKVFETGGQVNSVLAVAAPGFDQATLAADISAVAASDGREVLTGKQVVAQTQSDLRDRFKGLKVFLTAFAGLALFVGMFVISNTFSILVAQRTRELALLRAVGASRRQVLVSVLGEALVVAVVASAVGLVAGLGLAVGLRAAFRVTGITLPGGALVLETRTIIVTMAVGVLITAVSAWFPAWRAGSVPPLAAIRDVAIDRSAASRARRWIGLVLLALDVAVVIKGLSGNGSPLTEGAGFALAVVTVTVLGPIIARPLGLLLGLLPARLAGVRGALARQNAVRNPRRTARTAMALTIGVSVVGLVLTFVASFNGQVARVVDGDFKADYVIASKSFRGFSPEVAKAVAKVDGVSAVSAVRFGELKIAGDKQFVAAFDTKRIDQLLVVPVVAGSMASVGPGAIALGDATARKLGVTLGGTIDANWSSGPVKLTVAALLDENKVRGLIQGGSAIVSLDTLIAGTGSVLDDMVYLKATSGANLDAVATALDAAVVDYPSTEVLDQAEYKRSIASQLNQFVAVIFILLALSVVIALFGVVNTLMLSVHERTREIGLLRAVGMTRRQVRSMVRWESVIMAVLGVVVGLALGVVFGVLVMRSLRGDGFTETVVPVRSLIVITGIAMVLGVVSGIRPARRASRLDILAAVATE